MTNMIRSASGIQPICRFLMFILLVKIKQAAMWELDACDLLCYVPWKIVYYANYGSINMDSIFLLSVLSYIAFTDLG